MKLNLMKMGAIGFFVFLVPVLAIGEYPDREVTVYNGSSAGGVTDLASRLLSDTVGKTIGQPVVVVNKPGAAHTVCANLVANAKPDGYTLGALSSSAFTQVPHMRKVPYDFRKDFTWIVTYTEYTSGLVVKADAPWKTLEEFLDYAKKNPGKIIYGSDGFGMGTHILMEYIALKRGGIDWKHVPIAGGPKLATALLGGHIHAWSAAGTHVQMIKDKTVRLLVSFNNYRMKAAPDVPTLQELKITNLSVGTALVIVGPKNLPEPIRKKLEDAYVKAMKEPSYWQYLDNVEFPHVFLGSKETAKTMELQSRGWGEMIRVTGIKEDQK
ncbi:MAG TPA: tripartite tricarboxylate transporter substrate binding protein [Thermodesulfobacteriota bacterium]|nr:tripartite tricarboxylate transporter substrate binding protein [Thermodesulfobacteriota bacterium]